jgi:hypothetical protein
MYHLKSAMDGGLIGEERLTKLSFMRTMKTSAEMGIHIFVVD